MLLYGSSETTFKFFDLPHPAGKFIIQGSVCLSKLSSEDQRFMDKITFFNISNIPKVKKPD